MICLAFEFTSDRRSVAVSDGDRRVLAEAVHDRGRTTPVFQLVERALAEAGLCRVAVERLAVSIGPGSYTGIRLAIAAAQGWHLGTGVEVVAVDTFEALLRQTRRQPSSGPRVLCVNAQRQEFAVREWSGGGWTGPLHLESTEGLLQRRAAGEALFGPDLRAWIQGLPATSVGPGGSPANPVDRADIDRWAEAVEAFPTAGDVALLAATATPVPPETLAPIYLREAAFVKAPPHRRIAGITD
ncbi:MAG: tRNA (adenosine(37)-N6)-threonylcarbamoyltransferase complex dimerization subunit type 1 TsaB [Verrucomicrobiota bacterium]